MNKKSPVLWFFIFLLAIAWFAILGPVEKSLGTNVRVVYLHGALLTLLAASQMARWWQQLERR